MSSAFAGVWFEPTAAQLHIGVASPEGRRAAEGVVAHTGLAADVVVTPVRSTMAELLATQRQWNRKLADLFARGDVTTGLEPKLNAVSVSLSSSVSPAERAVLKHEASTADVNILVSVVQGSQLSVTPLAETKCTIFSPPWEKEEADCNRSLTSGVLIATRQRSGCTAGPLAIPLANRKERVVLTAGHCIDQEVNPFEVEWLAWNTKNEPGVIGKPENFSEGAKVGTKLGTKEANYCAGLCTGGDFGDIRIEPVWQTGNANNPVFAVTAEWKRKEPKSYPVSKEGIPMQGVTNCHEGYVSGESCGEILRLNVTGAWLHAEKIYILEGLVEDVGRGELIGEKGDSGGPWFYEPKLGNPNHEVEMEGTTVGITPECIKLTKKEKGVKYFPTLAECQSAEVLKENEEREGEWERKEYKCTLNEISKTGPNFYKTEANCKAGTQAGKGTWERKPEIHLVWEPLKQPVAGAAKGSLEVLKLELLTKKNETIHPEFYHCDQVGAKKGAWETSNCAKEETEGEYEKERLATTAKVGLTLAGGETIFETEDGGGIKCTKSEGAGEISEPTEIAKLKPVYKGCEEIDTKTKCKSGTVEGEVVANPLRGTPVYLDAALTKVGLLVEAEGGGALAKFKCGVYEWEITDSFICAITPENTMTTSYTLTCNIGTKEGFRRQEWRDVEETTPLHEIWLWLRHGEEYAGAPSAVGTTATVTSGESVEINAGGSPTVTSGSAASIGEREATLQGTVNPEGVETKYYFEYGITESYGSKTAEASAGSGTSSVEVSKTITGLTANTKYYYRLVATNSNGTTDGTNQTFTTTTQWSAQEPPVPTGAKFSDLFGGACTSSTECIGVGYFESSSEKDVPLAEKWSGTTWSSQEPPAPTGAKFSDLRGASCASSTACIAVGAFENSSEKDVPLAEKWNGTTWSSQEPPAPTGAKFSYLFGVSCASSTACIAVGFVENSSGTWVPLAEKWNGTAWSSQEPPAPTGATSSDLSGVSCASSTECIAVGYFENNSSEYVSLADRYE
jgi:hypothetical protein